MKPGQTKVMISQAHKIITEITIGYLTMPFPVNIYVVDLCVSCEINLARQKHKSALEGTCSCSGVIDCDVELH